MNLIRREFEFFLKLPMAGALIERKTAKFTIF